MKKLLLFTFLSVSFFIFSNAVEAKESEDLGNYNYAANIKYHDLTEILKDSEYKKYYDNLKPLMEETCSTTYGSNYGYIITWSNSSNTKQLWGNCFADADGFTKATVTATNYNDKYPKVDIQFKIHHMIGETTFYSNYGGARKNYSQETDLSGNLFNASININEESEITDKNIYFESNLDFSFDIYTPNVWYNYYSSLTINGTTYNVGDTIILGNSTYHPVTYPNLNVEELSYELDSMSRYTSRTFKFSFDNFDTEKYDYYFSKDGVVDLDFKENDVRITFSADATIYFSVKDKEGNLLKKYSYEVTDIYKKVSIDEANKHNVGKIEDITEVDEESAINEGDDSIGSYFTRFVKLFYARFPIITQISDIITKWSDFDPYYSPDREILATVRCPKIGDVVYEIDGGPAFCDIVWESRYKNKIPRLKINLSFFKMNKEFEIVDMGVLIKHRDDYFKWIYLSIGTLTLFKVLDNVRKTVSKDGD